MVNKKLLVSFLQVYAFQPATAFWRSVEVNILQKYLPEKGKVLDLGCGDGKLTEIAFDKFDYQNLILIGIDSDKDETTYAARNPIYTRVHTCLASQIPEPDETFDHCISNSVLEHIEDIDATIAEVSRLLKPNGSFTITVPGPRFHDCLSGPICNPKMRETYLTEMDKRLAHYRYWGLDEWDKVFSKNNLSIKAYEFFLNCHEVRRWETISRFTAGVFYSMSKGTRRPIQMQKSLGLRNLQNRFQLPTWFATLLAGLLTFNLPKSSTKHQGCLLIQAQKDKL